MSTRALGMFPLTTPLPRARADASRLGLWVFLATVAMLFAAFSSAYLVRRGGADWVPIALPAALWGNTVVLVASSLALELAWVAGSRRWRQLPHVAFGGALVLGVWFLRGQALAWSELSASGVWLATGPHGAFVYVLTVVHSLHIVAALGVLAWGAFATWAGLMRTDRDRWRQIMSRCRTFWHFLLGVWIYVFALLSAS